MPKIIWFRFDTTKTASPRIQATLPVTQIEPRQTPKTRRFNAVDVSLVALLCVIVLLLAVLPSAPGLGINPKSSPAPSEQAALNKPKATATPSSNGSKGVIIRQNVLKDTANAQISIPRIEGMQDQAAQKAFNELLYRESGAQSLLELAAQREADTNDNMWEASLQYAVEQIGRVLHITTFAYTYTGGAHGAQARNEFYLDPLTGSIYRLSDMFTDPSAAQDAIAAYIDSVIEANGDAFFPDAQAAPLPATFRIRQDGLEIYYPPYAIAPYAEGFPAFVIPWSTVNPYINHDSQFIIALNSK